MNPRRVTEALCVFSLISQTEGPVMPSPASPVTVTLASCFFRVSAPGCVRPSGLLAYHFLCASFLPIFRASYLKPLQGRPLVIHSDSSVSAGPKICLPHFLDSVSAAEIRNLQKHHRCWSLMKSRARNSPRLLVAGSAVLPHAPVGGGPDWVSCFSGA